MKVIWILMRANHFLQYLCPHIPILIDNGMSEVGLDAMWFMCIQTSGDTADHQINDTQHTYVLVVYHMEKTEDMEPFGSSEQSSGKILDANFGSITRIWMTYIPVSLKFFWLVFLQTCASSTFSHFENIYFCPTVNHCDINLHVNSNKCLVNFDSRYTSANWPIHIDTSHIWTSWRMVQEASLPAFRSKYF